MHVCNNCVHRYFAICFQRSGHHLCWCNWNTFYYIIYIPISLQWLCVIDYKVEIVSKQGELRYNPNVCVTGRNAGIDDKISMILFPLLPFLVHLQRRMYTTTETWLRARSNPQWRGSAFSSQPTRLRPRCKHSHSVTKLKALACIWPYIYIYNRSIMYRSTWVSPTYCTARRCRWICCFVY